MFRVFSALRIALCFVVLALSPAVGFPARQQPNLPATTVDVDTVGPQVGDSLPDFSLRDQGGRERSLKSLLGPNGAVVVFYRSADW